MPVPLLSVNQDMYDRDKYVLKCKGRIQEIILRATEQAARARGAKEDKTTSAALFNALSSLC